MEWLFGPRWAFALIPLIFGGAVYLSIMVRQPTRQIARLALVFGAFCGAISAGLLFDGYSQAAEDRVIDECMKSRQAHECLPDGSRMGFVGNEIESSER